MGFGVAFAGGGTKGAAHVGVLLALEEAGMRPTSVAGASAGSIVGGLYAAGISPYQLKNIIIELSKKGFKLLDPNLIGMVKTIAQFINFKPITLSGLIKGDKLERFICGLTQGKNIRDVNMRTVIPCVDLNSGSTIAYTNSLAGVMPMSMVKWETDVPLCEAIRASCSIPAVFQPKKLGDHYLVDGGVTDVLPVDLLIASGEKNVLAVDLSVEYTAPKINNIIEISSHSMSIMRSRLDNYVSSGEKLMLKPNLPENAGVLTFEHMVGCMEAGYDATIKMMPVIKGMFETTSK